jgi:predicted metal-binding protein
MALGEGKFDEERRSKSTRTSGQAASQPSKRLNRVYNCIESLSEQSGAERRHLVKCELVRREECKKKKKKACERYSGNQLGRV